MQAARIIQASSMSSGRIDAVHAQGIVLLASACVWTGGMLHASGFTSLASGVCA